MMKRYFKLLYICVLGWATISIFNTSATATSPSLKLDNSLFLVVCTPQYVDSVFFLEPNSSVLPINIDSSVAFRLELADKISQKYNVPVPVALKIVNAVHAESQAQDLDPLLVLAIIAQESGFNPKAQNKSGAIGLMQAIPRWHQEKIKNLGLSNQQLLSVEPNVRLGVVILKDYLRMSNGNMALALQKYNGSAKDRSQRYSNKIMSHYNWFAQKG